MVKNKNADKEIKDVNKLLALCENNAKVISENKESWIWIYVNIVDRKNRNFYAIFLANASH